MSKSLDLDALAALEAAATPGPWEISDGWVSGSGLAVMHDGVALLESDGSATECFTHGADAQLVAAARNSLPALIERVRVAEADAEQFRLMGASADAARGEWQRRALAAEARIDAVRALVAEHDAALAAYDDAWDPRLPPRLSIERLRAALDGA